MTKAGIRYEGFSGSSGDPLYSVAHTLRFLGGNAALATLLAPAGDLNNDHTIDFFYDQRLEQDGTKPQYSSKMISSRSGRKIGQGNPWFPLLASLDGRGDDIVRVTFDEKAARLEIAAVDGAGRGQLWTAHYRVRERIFGLMNSESDGSKEWSLRLSGRGDDDFGSPLRVGRRSRC